MDRRVIKNYTPLVYFSYLWEGSENKPNVYSIDKKITWSHDLEVITKEINHIESLKELQVYVNPQRPNEAVLNIEISKNSYSLSFFDKTSLTFSKLFYSFY